MSIKRLRATSEIDKRKLKLGVVNMVLTVVLPWAPLLLGGRDTHFSIYEIILLLVHSSLEQSERELSLVAYIYTACHGSQMLVLSKHIYSHADLHGIIRNVSGTPAQNKRICSENSCSLHEDNADFLKIGVQLFRKSEFPFSANMPCSHARVMTLCLSTCVLPCALQVAHKILHSMLVLSLARFQPFYLSKTTLSDQRPHFLYCVQN